LSDQRDETGGRENEADIDLCPLLRGEVDRDERSKAGLHIGDEKYEPIKAAQAARRRRQRRFATVCRLARRISHLVSERAALVLTAA
jgi:hypothetical protein